MPRFRFHIEWDDNWGSRDRAKEHLREIWDEIEGLDTDVDTEETPTLEVFDVIPHPAKGGGAIISPPEIPPVHAQGLIPPFEVTHPWDEGIMIFPPDHPLSTLERTVYESQMPSDQKDDVQRELLEAQRALPPVENDPRP